MSAQLQPRSAVTDALRQLLGERLSTSHSVREQHGRDESYHAPALPDAVVFARSTEEVAAIVEACARHRTPVIAFGTGTSLEATSRRSTAASASISRAWTKCSK